MSNDQHKTNVQRECDAEDQLVDWGLKATSGAEAPPDLSDKILAAIATDASTEPTTKATKADSPNRNRLAWCVGIAASLLLMSIAGSQFLTQGHNARIAKSKHTRIDDVNSSNEVAKPEGTVASPSEERENKQKMMMVTPAIILQEEEEESQLGLVELSKGCLLYTSPSPRDKRQSRMPSSA